MMRRAQINIKEASKLEIRYQTMNMGVSVRNDPMTAQNYSPTDIIIKTNKWKNTTMELE